MITKKQKKAENYFIYIYSDGRIYARLTVPVIKNLAKKYAKGIFDTEKAIKAFYNVATEGAKAYAREYAHIEEMNKIFTVADRKATACALLEYYWENINGLNPIN